MLKRLAVALLGLGLGACAPTTHEDGYYRPAGDAALTGDPAGGNDASGDPAGGNDASGDPASGNNASGDPTSGNSTSGDPGLAGDSPTGCPDQQADVITDVTVDDLEQSIEAGDSLAVVDVREPDEHAGGIIKGALLYPWTSGVLDDDHADLPTDKPLYIICRSGNRSRSASQFLLDNGHSCIRNVLGGMSAWSAADYPTVAP